jgi:hypothetical protein
MRKLLIQGETRVKSIWDYNALIREMAKNGG